jgi:endonuclease-3 related protein
MKINFRDVFLLLKQWFDFPTPHYDDFDAWRYETYEALKAGRLSNLPLKTWWPKYTTGDFRLELCIGALLIQRLKWPQVRTCIKNLDDFLSDNGKEFDIDGLLSISAERFQSLIRASRYPKVKTGRILKFCSFVKEQGTIDNVFRSAEAQSLEKKLQNLKSGFGDETRDCTFLYAANLPVFIADAYARKLLQILDVTSRNNYNNCQKIFQEAIQRDFSKEQLESILGEYTDEELHYVLCNPPAQQSIGLVLLYQQFHAGIVELGISKRWHEFVQLLRG